ncbi:4-carboxymuconolactone decarboxylase [Nocardioides sp. Root1257]|uniref:carboxymuconolactone decarboxylase family protein n=1 Tax=unclassified Nocardioides TaxID=2615069 RepID=UPI0006F2501D|nr:MULTISPECIES: carboxymuconolactone decarboxylase family protein [unclassified Nocardioides]KQW42670.1 4-carboxymuconolactone decarboxylase [Nocardioides sp. Root1257]KRC39928.1 4-carboxymuconolactone decarboxylase [Nocardioides sp. Root224]
MTEQKPSQPTGEATRRLGDVAPNFAAITDGLLYTDTWGDPALSPRERSLITVASLVSLYRTDQIDHHLTRAIENGVTKEELAHVITHLAFYAGWPAAFTAMTHLKEIPEA